MDIALMAHIPYKLISWRIKYIMKRSSKLNNAKRCAKMPPYFRNCINKKFPYFINQNF